ncbi:MAG: hypothetical protein AAF495_00805 [Pseudomonadota bacterium]
MNSTPSQSLTGLEKDIVAKGKITAEDVLALRRAVYQDGEIKRAEADFIFRLNRNCAEADPAWDSFYVEALSDYFFWQRGPRSTLSDEDAGVLIQWINEDQKIDDHNELKLLVNIMSRSQGSPDSLKVFVLDALKDSVLNSDQAIGGGGARLPGAIDQDDIDIIRKVIYGPASEGGIGICREEAELLFQLNNATKGADNVADWKQLFVKAIAMHLLYRGNSPEMIDEDEAQWLADQIDESGSDHGNEIDLLDYVIQEAEKVHPLIPELHKRLSRAQAAA